MYQFDIMDGSITAAKIDDEYVAVCCFRISE
jgi:hypothetical protein